MADNVTTIEFKESWLPVRVTFLQDGEVCSTHLIEDAGVLDVPGYGPDVVCVVEFADGKVAACKTATVIAES